jgi:TP901 family phage tail tape measure protein
MADRNLALSLLITARDGASRVLAGVRDVVRRLGSDARQAVNAFRDVGLAIEGVRTIAATLGRLTGLSALFAGLKQGVQGAGSLQAAMSQLAAVSGATAEDLGLLQARAEALGASDQLQVSSRQAADAMIELGRAGYSTEQILASVDDVLALGQGNALAFGDAAGIVAAALSGMGLEADQAGRAADVLSLAAQSANTSVQGLAGALGYAAPSAAAAGQSIEETVAQIARMQDAGIAGERAGTALNSMLAQLADPASKASRALSEAGINTRAFSEVVEALIQRGPQAERAILAFGTEAGPALRALLGQGSGAIGDLAAKLDDAGGAAQRAAAQMGANLSGALETASSAWDAALSQFAQPLLAPLEREVRSAAAAISGFASSNQFGRLRQRAVETFEAAAAAARGWIESIDAEAVVSRVERIADSVRDAMQGIAARVEEINAATKGALQGILALFDAVAAGWNTARSIIEGLFAALTGLSDVLLRSLAATLDGLAAIGAPVRGLAQDVRAAHELMRETSRQAAEAMIEHAQQASTQGERAWRRLIDVLGNTGAAAQAAADRAEDAAGRIAQNLTDAERLAAEEATGLTEQERLLAEQWGDTADAADAAGGATRRNARAVSAAGRGAAGAAEDIQALRDAIDGLADAPPPRSLLEIGRELPLIEDLIQGGRLDDAAEQIRRIAEELTAVKRAAGDDLGSIDGGYLDLLRRQLGELTDELERGGGRQPQPPQPGGDLPPGPGSPSPVGSAPSVAPAPVSVSLRLDPASRDALLAEIAALRPVVTVAVVPQVVGGGGGDVVPGTDSPPLEIAAAQDGETTPEVQ